MNARNILFIVGSTLTGLLIPYLNSPINAVQNLESEPAQADKKSERPSPGAEVTPNQPKVITTEVQPKPVIELSGNGQKVKKVGLQDSLTIVSMKYAGSGHFSVTALNDQGDYVKLLANQTGPCEISKPLEVGKKGEYYLNVQAEDEWSIRISQPEEPVYPRKAFEGEGDQATSLFSLKKGLQAFQMKHDGEGHFSVILRDGKGRYINLLANSSGNFDGSKAVKVKADGTFILEISADGRWSVVMD